MHAAAGGLLTVALVLALTPLCEAQMMKLGEVLVLNVCELKPGTDATAFEAHVRDRALPALKSAAPGLEIHLFRADRGARKGQYALAWVIDTLARRSTQDPRTGGAAFAAEVVKSLGSFVTGSGPSYEFQLLAPGTAGTLPEVDVLGIHFARVKPERSDAFERFIGASVHPAVANLRPDLRVLYYKTVRGGEAGHYIALFALTQTSRDKYWPRGADSDELKAAFGPVRHLTKELATYLVDGSYLADEKFAAAVYESREWADFVRVSATPR